MVKISFTYDPTTDRGKIRLLIFDTTDGVEGTDYVFSDAAIDAFLEINSDSIWLAAADAARSLAAKNIPKAFSLRLEGALEIDKKQIGRYFLSLAGDYEKRANSSSDTIVEYVDSFATGVNILGQDESEYVGDI